METVVLALIGALSTLIISFVIAYFNRETAKKVESLRSDVSDLKNRSFYTFSKYHELQIEAIKVLYPKVIDLGIAIENLTNKFYNENVEESQRVKFEKLRTILVDLNTSIKKNSIFFDTITISKLNALLYPVVNWFLVVGEHLYVLENPSGPTWRQDVSERRDKMQDEMKINIPVILENLEKNFKEVLTKQKTEI